MHYRKMSYQQANMLMWDVLRLIWKTVDRRKPTIYEVRNIGDIQHRILDNLAAGRFVIVLDDAGELAGFACWWKTDREGLDAALSNMIPAERDEGYYGFVTDLAAKPGYIGAVIAHMRSVTGRRAATWYRGKNGKIFCGERGKFSGQPPASPPAMTEKALRKAHKRRDLGKTENTNA